MPKTFPIQCWLNNSEQCLPPKHYTFAFFAILDLADSSKWHVCVDCIIGADVRMGRCSFICTAETSRKVFSHGCEPSDYRCE